MRFTITSLFFLIALVAAVLWGVNQTIYAHKLTSRAVIYIPPVASDEVLFLSLSPSDGILTIGDNVSARLTLTKQYGNISNVVASHTIAQGNSSLWIQSPKLYSPDKREFGLTVAGKTYTATANIDQVNLSIQPLTKLHKHQKLLLMQIIDAPTAPQPTTYSLHIQATNRITHPGNTDVPAGTSSLRNAILF